MFPTPDLDVLFTYHPPTEATAPRYAAVNAAFQEAVRAVTGDWPAETLRTTVAGECAAALRTFGQAILDNTPPSADRTAAIRSLRLARNAINEALFGEPPIEGTREEYLDLVSRLPAQYLCEAKWQANSAIALEGK